jgi:hypothetical protein
MSGQNTPEAIIKLLISKNVRIMFWKEEGNLATNMADRLGHQGRLGHQKVTKEYLAGPNVSVPRRMTGVTKNGENKP